MPGGLTKAHVPVEPKRLRVTYRQPERREPSQRCLTPVQIYRRIGHGQPSVLSPGNYHERGVRGVQRL